MLSLDRSAFASSLALSVAALAFASSATAQDTAPAAVDAPAKATAPAEAKFEYVAIRTSKGDIVLELDAAKAPLSVENFLAYAKEGFYDNTVYHRVIPNFMVQGGGFATDGKQKPTKAGVKNEWRNGLSNTRGTIAMARLGNRPDSATAQFFINLKDNGFLDQPRDGAGYAVFGQVIAGMDVVDAIAAAPTTQKNGMNDWPVEDVVMKKVEVISKDSAMKAKEEAAKKAPAAPAAPAAPKGG